MPHLGKHKGNAVEFTVEYEMIDAVCVVCGVGIFGDGGCDHREGIRITARALMDGAPFGSMFDITIAAEGNDHDNVSELRSADRVREDDKGPDDAG